MGLGLGRDGMSKRTNSKPANTTYDTCRAASDWHPFRWYTIASSTVLVFRRDSPASANVRPITSRTNTRPHNNKNTAATVLNTTELEQCKPIRKLRTTPHPLDRCRCSKRDSIAFCRLSSHHLLSQLSSIVESSSADQSKKNENNDQNQSSR